MAENLRCPEWAARILDANANVYRSLFKSIPFWGILGLLILFVIGFGACVLVLCLAVVGGNHIINDPSYPALLEEAPLFDYWVMQTSVNLFAFGLKGVAILGVVSIALAAARLYVSRRRA